MSKKFRSVVVRRVIALMIVFSLLSLSLSRSINPVISFGILLGCSILAVVLGALTFLVLYNYRERRPLRVDIADDMGWVLFFPIVLTAGVFIWVMEGRSDIPEQILGITSFLIIMGLPFYSGLLLIAEVDEWRKPD